jgi:hypothetical protein
MKDLILPLIFTMLVLIYSKSGARLGLGEVIKSREHR